MKSKERTDVVEPVVEPAHRRHPWNDVVFCLCLVGVGWALRAWWSSPEGPPPTISYFNRSGVDGMVLTYEGNTYYNTNPAGRWVDEKGEEVLLGRHYPFVVDQGELFEVLNQLETKARGCRLVDAADSKK